MTLPKSKGSRRKTEQIQIGYDNSQVNQKEMTHIDTGKGDVDNILRRISRSSSMNSVEARQLEQALGRLAQYGGDDKHDGDNEGFTFEEEWRIVAMTIDRIFLVFFSVVFVVGTIACFANTEYVR